MKICSIYNLNCLFFNGNLGQLGSEILITGFNGIKLNMKCSGNVADVVLIVFEVVDLIVVKSVGFTVVVVDDDNDGL